MCAVRGGKCVCLEGREVGGGGGSAGKGCVYPICSLPLPCGRKNHWPALSLIPEDTGAERGTGQEAGLGGWRLGTRREVGHRGWPMNLPVECVRLGVRMCSLS